MLVRAIFLAFLFLALAATSACSDSANQETVTGKGSIRALHTIPNVGVVSFLIEETVLGSITFQSATGISQYDDLEYEFRFEITLPDDDPEEPTELVSRSVDVAADQEYTFVLAGTLDNPQLYLWEQFGRDWAEEIETAEENETEVTVMEVSFGHAATSLGNVDIYLEDPGTSPSAATPRATLDYSEFGAALELSAGDYQLVITPAGEPDTFLFASNPFSLSAATSTLITLLEDGGYTTADISISLIGAGSGTDLADINSTAVISAVHAALGTDPIDIFDTDDLSSPIIDSLRFGEVSDELALESGTFNMIVTPEDNLGVFLTQNAVNAVAGTYNRLFFVGLPGAIQAVSQRYDHSTIATHAKLQLFQAAVRFSTVDVYVVETDTDIQLIGPSYASVLFGSGFSYVSLEADEYNIFVTEPGTKNVIAGPLSVNLEESHNYSLVITDSPNISAAELVFFEDSSL